jgi:FtsH-binding integral membrane protein
MEFTRTITLDRTLSAYLQKTYSLLLLGLLFTFGAVYLTFTNSAFFSFAVGHPFILFFGWIGTIFWANSAGRSSSGAMALTSFYASTFVGGMVMAPAILRVASFDNGFTIITLALTTTTLTFLGLTGYVFVSRRDFSFMRGFLITGLLAVIGASLLSLLFSSSAFSFGVSVAAALLFSGFILYDTSQVLQRAASIPPTLAALRFYLDFINLFMALLRIFSGNRN